VPGIAGINGDTEDVEGMRMGLGFRSTLRLAATVATAAAVLGAAATARRLISQPATDPPRHRASRTSTDRARTIRPATPGLASATVLTADFRDVTTPPKFHPFGPEPCIAPSHGIEIRTTPTAEVIELEASGELDGEPSPTERLLARRHSWDEPTSGSARDAPHAAQRYG
jgi:hypothetical protein